MNIYLIIGIILIGLGTYFTYYGSQLSSNKSAEALENKIEEVKNEIRSAKSDTTLQKTNEIISDIENEFSAWAKKFIKEKKTRKVKFDKSRISTLEKQLEYSKYWGPYIEEFLSTIKEMVTAYNENSKTNYLIEFPELTENLCEKSFFGFIKFADNKYWQILISDCLSEHSNEIPSMIVSMENENKIINFTESIHIRSASYVSIINANSDVKSDYFSINNSTSLITESKLFGDFNLNEFKIKCSDALTNMFEIQIHLLEENK